MNSLSSEPEPKKIPWYFRKAGNSEFHLVIPNPSVNTIFLTHSQFTEIPWNQNIEMINSKYLLLGDYMNVFLIIAWVMTTEDFVLSDSAVNYMVWNLYVDPDPNM